MSGDMMSTVTNKRRCEAVPADDVDIKEEPSNPKTPPLELEVYQAAEPVHASDVSASLQAHAFGSSKNKDIDPRYGQRAAPTSVLGHHRGGFLSFQAEYSSYYETARESREAIMRSMADVVARLHRGSPEHEGGFNSWSTSWRDPHCVSSMGTERATDENVSDRKVAIAKRCRNVAMTNTWRLRDGASINSEGSEAFPQHISEKTTTEKTSRLKKYQKETKLTIELIDTESDMSEDPAAIEKWSEYVDKYVVGEDSISDELRDQLAKKPVFLPR
ncbi:hypothetical protein MRX96_013806 [Rhipicephalus microplus]